MSTSEISLTGLHIYPVKSCAGIDLQTSDLDGMGLRYDRRWMIVDNAGKMLTQRTHPQLALIETGIREGQLTLSSFGMDAFAVPHCDAHTPRMKATVWNDTVNAWHIQAADQWLEQAVGETCHLVQIPDDEVRTCDQTYAKPDDHTGFTDGFPLLLISQASLDDLNNRLDQPVEMRRFRPNLVVDGCDAYAEDGWSEIRIGDIVMRVVKPCSRCPIPTVDPDTGEVSSGEPLQTLATYREKDGEVFFGQNVIHDAPGKLRVGDHLTVLK